MTSDDSMDAPHGAGQTLGRPSQLVQSPGIAGVYDPAIGFECAGYRVTVYATPDKEPGWGWAIHPHPGSDRDIRTNWSVTAAEAKQDAWRELVRLIRGERRSGHAADDGRPH
jgi:hypothetical protein